MALSRTFAKGEILTAEDVNEYLVNRITRTVLTGSEVIGSLPSGGSISSACAVIDRDDVSGVSTITLTLNLSGIDFTSGPQNTSVGLVNEALRIVSPGAPLAGVSGNGSQTLEVAGIALNIRWSAEARTSANIRISGSYAVAVL